jgi:hypothetical protein
MVPILSDGERLLSFEGQNLSGATWRLCISGSKRAEDAELSGGVGTLSQDGVAFAYVGPEPYQSLLSALASSGVPRLVHVDVSGLERRDSNDTVFASPETAGRWRLITSISISTPMSDDSSARVRAGNILEPPKQKARLFSLTIAVYIVIALLIVIVFKL